MSEKLIRMNQLKTKRVISMLLASMMLFSLLLSSSTYAEAGIVWSNVGDGPFSVETTVDTSVYTYDGACYIAYTNGARSDKAVVKKLVDGSWEIVDDLHGDGYVTTETVQKFSFYVYEGTPYFAYLSEATGNIKVTVMKYEDTTGWIEVGATYGADEGELALYVYDGIPYVAFNSLNNIIVQKFIEGSAPLVGEPISDFASRLSLKGDDSGLLYLSYEDSIEGQMSVKVKRCSINAGGWVSVGTVSSGSASAPSLYVYDDIPYIAYTDRSLENNCIVKKFVDDKWERVGSDYVSQDFSSNNSLFVDSNGIPYVAYADHNPMAKVWKLDTATNNWVTADNTYGGYASSGRMTRLSLSVDEGIPYVAYISYGEVMVMRYAVAPSILSDPSNQTVMEGQTATFTVSADGTAPLKYQWLKENVNIEGANASTLTISNVQASHAGSYTCMVSNAAGSVTSEAAILTVNESGISSGPVIDGQTPADCLLSPEDKPVFEVNILGGTEPLSYRWLKDGVPLNDDGNIQGANTRTLTINGEIQISDLGHYSVIVSNSYGTAISRAAALKGQGSFSLSAAPGDENINLRWENFEYGNGQYNIIIDGESVPVGEYDITEDGFIEYELTGLENGRSYFLRVETMVDSASVSSDAVSATPHSHSIGAIAEQAMNPLTAGYAGTQTSKSINIENTGTGGLINLEATLNSGEDSSFEITEPLPIYLNKDATSSFAVIAKDGLGTGIYEEFITISADNMEPVTFMLTQIVNPGAATTPGIPTGVTAVAGDGQATVSFTPPVNNGGSPITGYTVTSSPAGRTVTGTGNSITVTGLTNGVSYTFTVKATNAVGESGASAPSNAVTPYRASRVDDDSPSTPATTPAPVNTNVVVLVNGKEENAGTAIQTKEGDRTVTTIKVDGEKLAKKLESEGLKAVVTIPVNTKSDVVVGELNAQMVKNMENKEAVLEVRTENVSYKIPAQQINIDAVSEKIGQNVALEDIKVQVTILKSPEETVKVLENSAQKGSFGVIAAPVDFTIKGSYEDKNIEINKFNAYVERLIAIPEGVDPNKITTGIAMEADGTVRHIPTQVIIIDGKYYARINSLTNSTYSVVWHPLEFADAANHWAKDAINDMGSRMVITGGADGLFQPDRNITRGEFAAIVVRALGLKPGVGTARFADVQDSDWYSGYIKTAYEYGIITGYSADKFGPEDNISREQAMTMIARAMKLTPLNAELTAGELQKLLGEFKDGEKAASFATDSIAACVKTGVILGKNSNTLAPKDKITRAEVAVIVKRMLQKANLIN